MSFDLRRWSMRYAIMSQSLSSRAMSFDLNRGVVTKMSFNRLNPFRAGRCLSTRKSVTKRKRTRIVSIPFEQGDVFRLYDSSFTAYWIVSIPFEQGDVFRQEAIERRSTEFGLNPFRAGRCLSTKYLRTNYVEMLESQSLSSRAMSFDLAKRGYAVCG